MCSFFLHSINSYTFAKILFRIIWMCVHSSYCCLYRRWIISVIQFKIHIMQCNLAFTNYSCDKMRSLCLCVYARACMCVSRCCRFLIHFMHCAFDWSKIHFRPFLTLYGILHASKKYVTQQQQHAFIFLYRILYVKCKIHCANSLSLCVSSAQVSM